MKYTIYDDNKLCKVNPQKYEIKRIFANNNGITNPISIVMQNNIKLDGKMCFLYGYGSYGHEEYLGHSSFANTLVDNGLIYAIAHIRGGGHLGQQWYDYEDGKYL